MSFFQRHPFGARFAAGAALVSVLGLLLGAGCGKGPPEQSADTNAPPKGTSGTNAAGATTTATPTGGGPVEFVYNETSKNPFFPGSSPIKKPETTVDTPEVSYTNLVLRSITERRVRKNRQIVVERLAWINQQTFAEGTVSKVRMPNGKLVTVRCREIGTNSVWVDIEGIGKRELVLPSPP